MKSPLRKQIFRPMALLLTLTVVLFTGISTWSTVRHRDEQIHRHMQAVTDALSSTSYPLTRDVVRRIGALVGGDLVVLNRRGERTESTRDVSDDLLQELRAFAHPSEDGRSAAVHSTVWNSRRYLVSVIPRPYGPRPGTLFVLLPRSDPASLLLQSLLPPLAVALPMLILALAAAGTVSDRIARRIDQVRGLFRRLAAGDFRPVAVSGRDDEIRDLVRSANDLSIQLRTLQQNLSAAERLQLLGQLSGGLAHQLRNSIAGARLAIQLHQRHCRQADDMTDTAIAQLNLTEEQVLAVISLNPDAPASEPESCRLKELIQEVCGLLRPLCAHWKTRLTIQADDRLQVLLRSRPSVKGALLNVVQNAVESAGVGGDVVVRTEEDEDGIAIRVLDSGPGFPDSASVLTEPFRTTRPDGIGLGLTIARHAVRQESGRLVIGRHAGRTSVTLMFPKHTEPALSTG